VSDHEIAADAEHSAEARVLAKLAEGWWQCLIEAEDCALAERLVAAGRLERLRQARRGFPAMYRLRQTD
jgi:hypothetical protein